MYNRNKYNNVNRDPREITAMFDSICDPREITAMFDSICEETGKKIPKGAKCIYYPTSKKVYSLDSKQASEFYSWQNDKTCGYDY